MVQLKKKVSNLDEVPENLRGLYVESPDGDGFVCDITVEQPASTGGVDPAKFAEFRDNNRQLRKENEMLAAKQSRYAALSGLDDDGVQKLIEDAKRAEDAENQKLIAEGKAEEVFTRRTQDMVDRHKTEISGYSSKFEEMQGNYAQMETKHHGLLIDTQLNTALNGAAAPRKQALVDIQNRARSVWSVREGQMTATSESTGEPLLDRDGKTLTMGSWVSSLVEDSPHLFEASKGGGAGGSGGTLARGTIDVNSIGANLEAVSKGNVRVQ